MEEWVANTDTRGYHEVKKCKVSNCSWTLSFDQLVGSKHGNLE